VKNINHYRHYSWPVYAAALFTAMFLMLPLLVVLPLSFNAQPFFTYPMQGLSLQWYIEVLTSSRWTGAILNSAVLGLISAAIATIIGTLASVGLWLIGARSRQLLLALLLSPLVIPAVVFAAGFLYLASRAGVANSLPGLVWAHVVLGLPFVVVVVSASLEQFDPILVRAARSLGADNRTIFVRIILPIIKPGVLTGLIFAFVTSWDEVVVALFVISSSDQYTLPRVLWGGLRENLSPALIALAALLTLLSLALMIAVERLRGTIRQAKHIKR
jgi:putative spermidine/putrescine transport system permease protein